jgi:hypothetical protein
MDLYDIDVAIGDIMVLSSHGPCGKDTQKASWHINFPTLMASYQVTHLILPSANNLKTCEVMATIMNEHFKEKFPDNLNLRIDLGVYSKCQNWRVLGSSKSKNRWKPTSGIYQRCPLEWDKDHPTGDEIRTYISVGDTFQHPENVIVLPDLSQTPVHQKGVDDYFEKKDLPPATVDQAKEVLNQIDNSGAGASWDIYRKVCCGLHHNFQGSTDGFKLFSWWCAKSDKYNPEQTQREWDSCHSNHPKPITMMTLVKMASGDPLVTIPSTVSSTTSTTSNVTSTTSSPPVLKPTPKLLQKKVVPDKEEKKKEPVESMSEESDSESPRTHRSSPPPNTQMPEEAENTEDELSWEEIAHRLQEAAKSKGLDFKEHELQDIYDDGEPEEKSDEAFVGSPLSQPPLSNVAPSLGLTSLIEQMASLSVHDNPDLSPTAAFIHHLEKYPMSKEKRKEILFHDPQGEMDNYMYRLRTWTRLKPGSPASIEHWIDRMQELYTCSDIQSANEHYQEILKDFARNIVIYRSGNSLELWMRSYDSVSKCFIWVLSKMDTDLWAAFKASVVTLKFDLGVAGETEGKRQKQTQPVHFDLLTDIQTFRESLLLSKSLRSYTKSWFRGVSLQSRAPSCLFQ